MTKDPEILFLKCRLGREGWKELRVRLSSLYVVIEGQVHKDVEQGSLGERTHEDNRQG